MTRPIPADLDEKMLRPERRPGYIVEIYDVRSSVGDTIGAIVRGLTLETITGPRDFTSDITSIDFVENAGDYASQGIPTTRIVLSFVDPGGVLDPLSGQAAVEGARFLRRGNVVRIREGDLDIDSTTWPFTFTGLLVGQAGVDRNRTTGNSVVTMAATGRESEFSPQIRTSEEFGRGAAYLTMGTDVATNVMGLDSDELDFFGWGTPSTGLPIQFVEQSAMVSLAQLMLGDGFLPRFDGEGKLTQTFGDVGKTPSRIYLNKDTIRSIIRPFSDLDPVNSVEVIGLDGQLSKIVQQQQQLAELQVTVGYFTSSEDIDVFWSEDRTILAENVILNIVKSVNGGLSALGAEETTADIIAPNQTTISVGVIITLSTGFAPYIIIFLAIVYIVLAIIPDIVVAFGSGFTISVGRLLQALALAGILILMSKIGRGVYVFRGEPVEFVHQELRAVAEIADLTAETRRALTIECHLLQSQAICDEVARVTLFRQQAKGNPRQVVALHDLALIPDDVFVFPDNSRFMIERISRRLVRDATAVLATYDCFEVTEGVLP